MLTEAQRRVICHLSEPHSLATLTRAAIADAHSPFGPPDTHEQTTQNVRGFLDEAVTNGWVVGLGKHSGSVSMSRAVRDAQGAITIDAGKMERRIARIDSGHDTRLDTGELFVLTELGLEQLQA